MLAFSFHVAVQTHSPVWGAASSLYMKFPPQFSLECETAELAKSKMALSAGRPILCPAPIPFKLTPARPAPPGLPRLMSLEQDSPLGIVAFLCPTLH